MHAAWSQYFENDACAGRHDAGVVTGKLHGIAKTLLGTQEDSVAGYLIRPNPQCLRESPPIIP